MAKRVATKVTNCDLKQTGLARINAVKEHILSIRGQRVMLDQYLVTDSARSSAIRALIDTPAKSQRPIGFIGTGKRGRKDEQ